MQGLKKDNKLKARIRRYNETYSGYNFHIDDSTKYIQNIFPNRIRNMCQCLDGCKECRKNLYEYPEDTIRWDTGTIFGKYGAKDLNTSSFYDDTEIHKDNLNNLFIDDTYPDTMYHDPISYHNVEHFDSDHDRTESFLGDGLFLPADGFLLPFGVPTGSSKTCCIVSSVLTILCCLCLCIMCLKNHPMSPFS